MNADVDRDTGPDPESVERREFTRQSILALLSGVAITIACGGDGESPTSPTPGGVSGSVSANHGHAATITDAQLTANNAVTLQIQGSANHPHTVELSAQEVGQIAARQRVSKTSSADDSQEAGRHSHTVTFN